MKKLFLIAFMLIQVCAHARYFDSKTNSFISRDPIGYRDGQSLYVGYFSTGMALDPTGLKKYVYDVHEMDPDQGNNKNSIIAEATIDFDVDTSKCNDGSGAGGKTFAETPNECAAPSIYETTQAGASNCTGPVDITVKFTWKKARAHPLNNPQVAIQAYNIFDSSQNRISQFGQDANGNITFETDLKRIPCKGGNIKGFLALGITTRNAATGRPLINPLFMINYDITIRECGDFDDKKDITVTFVRGPQYIRAGQLNPVLKP